MVSSSPNTVSASAKRREGWGNLDRLSQRLRPRVAKRADFREPGRRNIHEVSRAEQPAANEGLLRRVRGVAAHELKNRGRRHALRKVRTVRVKTLQRFPAFHRSGGVEAPVAEEKLSNGTLSRRAKRPVWMRVRFENVPGKTKAGKRKRVARPLVEGVSSMRFCASGAFGRRGRSARGPRARRSRAQG